MKKFITLLIVLVSVALQGIADTGHVLHLVSNLSDPAWTTDDSQNNYLFSFSWDGTNNQEVYEFTVTSAMIGDKDFSFNLNFWDEWGRLQPNSNDDVKITFSNGQYEQLNTKSGAAKAFVIEHSTIKAASYKLSVYRKFGDGAGAWLKVEIVDMPVSVGARGYATYCNANRALDFTGKRIKAYTVGSTNGSALTLTQVNKIAENIPVLLYSTTNSDSQNIPVITYDEGTDDVTGNKLVAGDDKYYTWAADKKYYILYTGGDKPGFYRANNSKVAIGKAYLNLTGVSASREFFAFPDDETTGINGVENGNVEAKATVIYNMNGQRVMNPSKGLYIVNGKKVIIK